jgi:tetratricopeptide (TPR) repeat protein
MVRAVGLITMLVKWHSLRRITWSFLMKLGKQVFCSIALSVATLGCELGASHYRNNAEELREQGLYEESNQAYLRHIESRLLIADRPEWENPYIYLLDIGDNYLLKGDVEEALRHYEKADAEGVDASYTTDRIRGVASWYEDRGELRQAIDLLKRYRERDELLIDMILDRLSRELAEQPGYGS